MKKLDTESYKGVRDFYPEDMWVMKWMFAKLRNTVETYGYVEYGASVLEPSDLYTAKSGEEIVNEQTYTFTDKGDRSVTLRPEMTPTVARMVAKKRRELGFPVRWYSIPNLFRYEAPQRGRLREHWQLNVDIFGEKHTEAEIEIIEIASKILTAFGANNNDFSIQINSRPLMKDLFDSFGITEENQYKLGKLIDKKEKIDKEVFEQALQEITDKSEEISRLLKEPKALLETLGDRESVKTLLHCINSLLLKGISNIIFSPTLMRGFDYYTGIVFEVFDTNPENKRSLFGGGRFDRLTELFDNESVPAVGFGMGDVTLRDFLETRNLIPKYVSSTDVAVVWQEENFEKNASSLIGLLREVGICVAEYGYTKNLGDFYKYAERNAIPFTIHLSKELLEKEQSIVIKKTQDKESGAHKSIASESDRKELLNYIQTNR